MIDSGAPKVADSSATDPELPPLCVVIPTKNRQADLARCLAALEHQTEKSFVVLVINNGSGVEYDGPLSIRILDATQTSFTPLLNLGWEAQGNEIIAYLNDDSEPEEGWVNSLLECFRIHSEARAVGGPTIDMRPRRMFSIYQETTSSPIVRLFVNFYERALLKGNVNDIGRVSDIGAYGLGGSMTESLKLDRDIEVDCLTVTNCAFTRDTLRRLGGFDESFQQNHADGDFFARMKRNGLAMIFSPKVVVYHHVNPTGPVRNPGTLGRDFALYYFKDFRPKGLRVSARFYMQIAILMTFWVREACVNGRLAYLSAIARFIGATPAAIKSSEVPRRVIEPV